MQPEFQMSFDGVRWHDWMRGFPGAEKTVIEKFRLLHARGYRTRASMCLNRHNIGDLKENIDLLASLGLSHLKMNIAAPAGRWKNKREHFLTQEEAHTAIIRYIPQYVADGMPIPVQFCGLIEFDKPRREILIPYARFSGKKDAEKSWTCGAVKNTLYISPRGKVLPCMMFVETAMNERFDSMLEKPLSGILSDSCYRDTCLRTMGECIRHNERCRDCTYRLLCGAGCRAAACGETGTDYLAIDEEVCCFFQKRRNTKCQTRKKKRLFSARTFPKRKWNR